MFKAIPANISDVERKRRKKSWVGVCFCLFSIACSGTLIYNVQVRHEERLCRDYGNDLRYDKAIPYCREVVRLKPWSAAALNNLGYYSVLGGHVEEGLKDCQEAVRRDPSETHYDSLAMAFALDGKGSEALLAEQHVNSFARHPKHLVTLGMVYYSLGHTQDALSKWNEAIRSGDPYTELLARSFKAKYEHIFTPTF